MSISEYFIFPYSFQDILLDSSESGYRVNSKINLEKQDDRKIKLQLTSIEKILRNNFISIKESEYFDYLFNLIKSFEDKSKTLFNDYGELVSEILQQSLQKILKDLVNIEAKTCYKMISFLIFYFINCTKIKIAKNSLKDDFQTKKIVKNENVVQIQKSLLNSLNLSFENQKQIWQNKIVDEQFYKYYLNMVFQIIENSSCLNDISVFENVIYSLKECFTYQSSEIQAMAIKLANIIMDLEESINPILKFLIGAYNSEDFQLRNFISDTIRGLVNLMIAKKNISGESQSVKNTKEILTTLSEQIPRFFNSNLSVFINLYESDHYMLRNAINEILGNIIKLVLTKSTFNQENDNMEQAEVNKKKLLDILIKRVYDKNAFCRSNVLQVFVILCLENVVPVEYLQPILKVCCERIKDVSANVRKKSMSCLQILIKYFFAIFVESQNKTQFLTFEQVQNEFQIVKIDLDQCIQRIKENEELMHKLQDHQNAEFEQLDAERKDLKRSLEKIKFLLKKLQDYQQFLKSIDIVLPLIIQLLGSKSIYDVTEAIKLMMVLNKYNIQNSDLGIKKLLALVWSKEKQVVDEVVQAYHTLYFNDQNPSKIAKNLINILNESNLTEATSFEELIIQMLSLNLEDKKKQITSFSPLVFKELWDYFLKSFQSQNEDDRKLMRCSLQLVRIISIKNTEYLQGKIEILISIINNISNNSNPDFFLLKEIAFIASNYNQQNTQRYKSLIQNLILIIYKFHGTDNGDWYCCMEQIINTVFIGNKNPEHLSQFLLLKLSGFLYSDSQNFEENLQIEYTGQDNKFENKLSQLIYTIGQISLKFLLILDELEQQLKKMKAEIELNIQKQNQQEDEEMNKIQGGVEAEFDKRQDLITEITEQYLVQKNLLSLYVPLIVGVCKQLSERKNDQKHLLERSAVLTLCKFMCVSPDFCKKNINLLIGFLKKDDIDPIIKNNILITLGDLLHRHPNIVEPYSDYLYSGLKEESVSVRKTCLMVMTHLILNDMLKAKGEICDVAILYNDSDIKLQGLVKLFFYEIQKKDQKIIYNLLPDFIGRLSRQDEKGIDENSFQLFAKDIMQYLEKDKYSESLVDKLCTRLKNQENEKELHNTSFCLSLLSYNEKGLRKLLECFDLYRNKLGDPIVFENFQNVLKRIKKNQKLEIKNLIDEWESKINNYLTENANDYKRKLPQKKMKKDQALKTNKKKPIDDESIMSVEYDETYLEQSEVPQNTRGRRQRKNQNYNEMEED